MTRPASTGPTGGTTHVDTHDAADSEWNRGDRRAEGGGTGRDVEARREGTASRWIATVGVVVPGGAADHRSGRPVDQARQGGVPAAVTLATTPRYEAGRVPALGEHAVVVGASVAGVLAARVLADGYERVTLVERDPIPDGPVARPAVPQGRHPHALAEAGRATMEDLFPGYGEDLVSAGGLLLDASREFDFYDEGGFLADGPRRMPLYAASRPLFEQVARRHVLDHDGVSLRAGCPWTDYLVDDRSGAVAGVVVRDGDAGRERLPADLVVDATGRTSRTPAWLDANGYAPPTLDEVRVDLAYSTVVVERPPDDRRIVWGPASAPRSRGGGAAPIEGGYRQVMVHGVHDDHPPTDLDGVREFAASLPFSDVERYLDGATLVSDGVDHYPFPSNRRYRYEGLDRFPDGLVVLGDAVASYNPIYGQGISVAALQALELHHALAAGGTDRLARRFFDRAADAVDVAWRMAVGADVGFAETTGPEPRGSRLLGRYLSRLTRRAHADGELREALFRVITMEVPPSTLLRPGVAWRVLRPTGGRADPAGERVRRPPTVDGGVPDE